MCGSAGFSPVEEGERKQIDCSNLRLFDEAVRVLPFGYILESVCGLPSSTGTATPTPVSADRELAG